MFTGLIETTGTVLTVTRAESAAMRLVIAAPSLAGRWHMGDSIAVNGVCLTALDVAEADERHPGRFAADLAAETVARTTLGTLQPGALVNLELPTPAGSPLGGHVVQGHVDATGTLVSLIALHPGNDNTDWRMTVDLPASFAPYVIPQGSITIDGISLTVASLSTSPAGLPRVEVALIPHTYRCTNLRALPAGSPVNIETDVLSKYAERRATLAVPAALQPGVSLAAATDHKRGPEWIEAGKNISGERAVASQAAEAVARPANPALTAAYLMERGY